LKIGLYALNAEVQKLKLNIKLLFVLIAEYYSINIKFKEGEKYVL